MTETDFERLGYHMPRRLPSGDWIALRSYMFTVGLMVGIDEHGCWRTRYCYETVRDAVGAVYSWNGLGDPPGPWLREKGVRERWNPRLFYGIPVVVESTKAVQP